MSCLRPKSAQASVEILIKIFKLGMWLLHVALVRWRDGMVLTDAGLQRAAVP